RRRHTRSTRDWSSDVCSSDLFGGGLRLWVCARHVYPSVRLRDTVLAGGFGAWGAYLTPFQSGSAPMSVWVMKRAGVPVPVAISRSEERRVGKGGRRGERTEAR